MRLLAELLGHVKDVARHPQSIHSLDDERTRVDTGMERNRPGQRLFDGAGQLQSAGVERPCGAGGPKAVVFLRLGDSEHGDDGLGTEALQRASVLANDLSRGFLQLQRPSFELARGELVEHA